MRSKLPAVPVAPFTPVPVLLLDPADSDLHEFLVEVHRFILSYPELLDLVEADLDAHALRKKVARVADAQWLANQTLPLPSVLGHFSASHSQPLALLQGRPRTSGFVVLMAILLRGYFGSGFKSHDSTSLIHESITLRVIFLNLGMTMPGRSTLTELTNALSNETRQRIFDAQMAYILTLKLDDFRTILIDSTDVKGNTQWPTDSCLMLALASRMIRLLDKLPRLQLPATDLGAALDRIAVIKKLDREIDLSRGKKDSARDRRKRYEKLLRATRRVHKLLTGALAIVDQALSRLNILPSRKAIAARAVAQLHSDLESLAKVSANCEARVLHQVKVKMADKMMSVSDPDASYITKGQRNAVIGYKPQLARTGAGFISGLLLPRGNASDADQLAPLVDEVIRSTSVVPNVLSMDDGYASIANVSRLVGRDIKVVSINGAKGRALTAPTDWDSQEYAGARSLRSAIESMIFTLKHGFGFGKMARRGLAAVHAEILEKALAYNLCHIVRLRKAKEAPDKLALTG